MAHDLVPRLDIIAILGDLGTAEVRYVLTGSVAALAYGVPAEPRDLDIAPDVEPENLSRLAYLLRRWGAKPMHDPQWPMSLSREECERWTPDPPTAENLDHLMRTPHGLFDVVPIRSGAYPELMRRAMPLECGVRTILVAHPADLIATLRVEKAKHHSRLPHLIALREHIEEGETIKLRLPQ